MYTYIIYMLHINYIQWTYKHDLYTLCIMISFSISNFQIALSLFILFVFWIYPLLLSISFIVLPKIMFLSLWHNNFIFYFRHCFCPFSYLDIVHVFMCLFLFWCLGLKLITLFYLVITCLIYFLLGYCGMVFLYFG